MKLTRILGLLSVVGVSLATVACGSSEGACVQQFDKTSPPTCNMLSKSVCEQGKDDKWVGGDCPTAGFPKKNKDGYWEK
jgi:hypothetical protein